MTTTLPPVSGFGHAQDARTLTTSGPGAPAMGRAPLAESAQALRPVDPSKSVRDIRGETARDKPVGPPPSFDVNVLQDMRETLRDPVDKPNAGEGDNIPQRREVEESEMAYGKSSQAASDPELNRKI